MFAHDEDHQQSVSFHLEPAQIIQRKWSPTHLCICSNIYFITALCQLFESASTDSMHTSQCECLVW